MPLIRPHRFDVSIDRNEDVLELARSFAGMTHATLTHGNAATIVQDGAFFDALVADFATARSSVHIENYLWKPGRTFDRVAEALETASRRGVEVRVIYDGVGAIGESEDRIEQLCDAGCSVARHRKLSILNLPRFNRRDHRKLAVIDGRIAFVFGHGIADEWQPAASAELHWRDTAVRRTEAGARDLSRGARGGTPQRHGVSVQ